MHSVSLRKISFDELLPRIRWAFADDPELETHYHIAAGTGVDLAEHTFTGLGEYKDVGGMQPYEVVLEVNGWHIPIGFTVILHEPDGSGGLEYSLLMSFGIHIRCREWAILEPWLQAVREEIGRDKWAVPLYPRNTRAINFFQRQGFKLEDTGDFTLLLWQ
jgi:hypothetical protein